MTLVTYHSAITIFGSDVVFRLSVPNSLGQVFGRAQAAATRADMIAVGPSEISLIESGQMGSNGVKWGQMRSNKEYTFEVPNIQYMNGPIKAEKSPNEVGNLAI